jgi:hypothetical protein
MMNIQPESLHPSDDALELYILNLLKAKDRESIELHLLTCELCILSAEAIYEEISVMRQALWQDVKVAQPVTAGGKSPTPQIPERQYRRSVNSGSAEYANFKNPPCFGGRTLVC